MTDRPTDRLSAEEMMALKFAAHRQLTRWAQKERLSPNERAQRAALARTSRTLARQVFAHGCHLRALEE